MSQATIIVANTPAEQLTTEQLVAEYNRLSGKAPIKGFHTRAKGISAVNLLRNPATTGTGNAAAKRASRKPSPVFATTIQQPATPGAGAMGALAATLNSADAEQAAINALAKARKSAKATKAPSAAAAEATAYTMDEDAIGAATVPPRMHAFLARITRAYPKGGFTKAQGIAAAVTSEPSGAEHHQRGNFNWAVRLGLFKAA